MKNAVIENIAPENHKVDGAYTPVKKINMGNCWLIFVYGVQPQPNAPDDVAEQTRLVFEDIKNLLALAGAGMDDVVRAVIYLKDMNDFNVVSPIRAEYFKNSKPAATTIQAGAFTRPGSKIEIEVTAVLPK